MAHHLSFLWQLPTVSPLTCFTEASSAAYLERKTASLGHTSYKLLYRGESRSEEHMFRVVTRKHVEVVLPDWARKLFKPKNAVTQVEHWRNVGTDGIYLVDLKITVAGVPVKIRGTGRVAPEGLVGSTFGLECTSSSKMPVFGERLAEFASSQVGRFMQGEGDFAVAWGEEYFPAPVSPVTSYAGYRPIPRRWEA